MKTIEELEEEARKRREEEERAKNRQDSIIAVLGGVAVIRKLHKIGPRTKLQYMQCGWTNRDVEHLIKYGILTREHNPTTNLYYLRVDDDIIRRCS